MTSTTQKRCNIMRDNEKDFIPIRDNEKDSIPIRENEKGSIPMNMNTMRKILFL